MCTSPRPASFHADGSINLSQRHFQHNRQFVPFKVPCGKCTECLLERARDWGTRCMHEASVHAQNAFITLTYSDQHLPSSGKVSKAEFQNFMRRLRRRYDNTKEIGVFYCGEYGEKTLRPHYHACLFGFDFEDKVPFGVNESGDQLWTSKELDEIWGKNDSEKFPNKIGTVTQKSAAYVARYILKKQNVLSDFEPFQDMSRRYSIGKRFLEKNWKDIFVHAQGSVVLSDGTQTKVPRYYEKWLKENHPEEWLCYITKIKPVNTKRLQLKAEYEHNIFLEERNKRRLNAYSYKSPLARKREVLQHKQKQLKRSYL